MENFMLSIWLWLKCTQTIYPKLSGHFCMQSWRGESKQTKKASAPTPFQYIKSPVWNSSGFPPFWGKNLKSGRRVPFPLEMGPCLTSTFDQFCPSTESIEDNTVCICLVQVSSILVDKACGFCLLAAHALFPKATEHAPSSQLLHAPSPHYDRACCIPSQLLALTKLHMLHPLQG